MITSKCGIILDATLRLLASRGFHGFSIRDVAKEAGIAIGTVYLYFEDRDDLIHKLHDQIMDKVATQVFSSHSPEDPLFQQFRRMCLNLWGLFLREPEIVLSKGQFDHLPDEILKMRYEEARVILAPLFAFYTQGRERQELKNLPDEVLFSLGFEPYFELARKSSRGTIHIDEQTLELVISASWDAIALK